MSSDESNDESIDESIDESNDEANEEACETLLSQKGKTILVHNGYTMHKNNKR